MREPICVGQRLCVTLRYLVTGAAHVTIAARYRMIPTTVGRIVKETCAVIWNVLCAKGYVSVIRKSLEKNLDRFSLFKLQKHVQYCTHGSL